MCLSVVSRPRPSASERDVLGPGPSYSPLETESDTKCVVESAHPYLPGEDSHWPVVIEGAEAIEVGEFGGGFCRRLGVSFRPRRGKLDGHGRGFLRD